MKRRDFLKAGSASLAGAALAGSGLISWIPRARAATLSKTLYVTDGYLTQPDGTDVYFQGFSSSATSLNVPGEALVVQAGDTVQLTIVNTLDSDHSFVIDGLLDSGPIAAGTSRTVEFTPARAGSFLYHDGLNAPFNRVVGLHGGLAVMPAGSSNELYAGSPTFVQQYLWLINEVDPVWHDELSRGRIPRTAFTPRYFTINGRSMRVPGHPEYGDPAIDSGYAADTRLVGSVGDRTLVRILNAGQCIHAVHFHANHVEWLASNGQPRADVWKKDTVRLPANKGGIDVIYPFEAPPDAWPQVSTGHFPMHFHNEMTQTAGGGLYQFGIATTIAFA